MTKKKTTGWTDADYEAAGIGSIRLRIPLWALERLQLLAAKADINRGEVVIRMIAAEYSRVFEGDETTAPKKKKAAPMAKKAASRSRAK